VGIRSDAAEAFTVVAVGVELPLPHLEPQPRTWGVYASRTTLRWRCRNWRTSHCCCCPVLFWVASPSLTPTNTK
jgi:hypothetical protein